MPPVPPLVKRGSFVSSHKKIIGILSAVAVVFSVILFAIVYIAYHYYSTNKKLVEDVKVVFSVSGTDPWPVVSGQTIPAELYASYRLKYEYKTFVESKPVVADGPTKIPWMSDEGGVLVFNPTFKIEPIAIPGIDDGKNIKIVLERAFSATNSTENLPWQRVAEINNVLPGPSATELLISEDANSAYLAAIGT